MIEVAQRLLTLEFLRSAVAGGLGAPMVVLAILAMMVLPLPPLLLDALFTFNISLSVVVLLASVYARRPLEFAAFPTILLVATLMRLSLNIASTRVVLLNGHEGPGAAGNVIQSFGEFVIGGNYAVGFVVFAILVIINFVVITKGAGRISEVTARFTLDAMPGKQMAIDADLNAGLINQEEAKTRRADVSEEADFYGAMDGASKFVRGDAVAGLLILLINITGGLAIGTLQQGMSIADAFQVFTLLTIGDGLVAQIPSLLLATASAIMVTRVSAEHDVGHQITSQLFENPQTLGLTAGVLGIMGVVPGMPNAAFLSMALVTGFLALWRQQRREQAASEEPPPPPASPERRELSWDDVTPVDALGLEVGYRLIPLVGQETEGQLLGRLRGVRKKLSEELGFLVPAVHIRDNLDLEPTQYRITVHGATLGQASINPNQELAINPGRVYGELKGTSVKDPVFKLDSVWIGPDQREAAHSLGYTVVDASTVVATHLSQIIQDHAHELLGHDEVQHLLDNAARISPKLVEDLVPATLPLSVVVKVMQALLREHVAIRDVRTILESLSAAASRSQDPDALVAQVRIAMGRAIVQQINGLSEELPVVTCSGSLEQLLQRSLSGAGENGVAVEPGLMNRILQSVRDAHERQELAGQPTVLLVADVLRGFISGVVRSAIPGVHVLAYSEVPGSSQIRIVANIGDAADGA